MNKIHKILLFFTLISSTLNALTPDKNNAKKLSENEIKCHQKLKTYEINNSKNKNYFVFIKNYYVSSYALFTDSGKEIPVDSYLHDDYFYRVSNYAKLYLVIDNYINYCYSFIFTDEKTITLKENEEFFHPVLNYVQNIEFKISDILNKFVILYFNNAKSYYIFLDNKSQGGTKYSSSFSYISEKDNMNIELQILDVNVVPSIKYKSFSYTNISKYTFFCKENSNIEHVYFINGDMSRNYIYIQFSNNNWEFYYNNELKQGLSFIQYYFSSDNYYILQKNKGCLELSYLDQKIIDIDPNVFYKILNSEKFEFKVNKPEKNRILKLSIFSEENNFIKEIYLGNEKIDFEIKNENNKYIYNYFQEYEGNYFPINPYHFTIKFNTNNKPYITVGFNLNYEIMENKAVKYSLIIVFSVFGFLGLIAFLCRGLPCLIRLYELKKKEKRKEEINNLYHLISKDFSLIEKICFVCLKNDQINFSNLNKKENELITTLNSNIIDDNDNDNNNEVNNNKNNFEIADDINKGRFQDLLSYVTPKKCTHFFHENCRKRKCYLCKNYITLENMKKFGCFFNYYEFRDSIESDKFEGSILKNLKKKFFSFVEGDKKILFYKKEKLLKIKRIIEKNVSNNIVFSYTHTKYYDLNIDADLDQVENKIDKEIEKKEERRRNWHDEDDDDNYYNHRNNNSNNNNNYNNRIREEREQNKKISLKVCIYCRKNCGICGSNIEAVGRAEGHTIGSGKSISAHKKCIRDEQNCYMCGKLGHKIAYNICFRCWGTKLGLKNSKQKDRINSCYYCHKRF